MQTRRTQGIPILEHLALEKKEDADAIHEF